MKVTLTKRPARPSLIRNWIRMEAIRLEEEGYEPKNLEGMRGAIVNELDKRCGGELERKVVLGWLFGDGNPMSSKILTQYQLKALLNWIRWTKVENDWFVDPRYAGEIKAVAKEAIEEFNKKDEEEYEYEES